MVGPKAAIGASPLPHLTEYTSHNSGRFQDRKSQNKTKPKFT